MNQSQSVQLTVPIVCYNNIDIYVIFQLGPQLSIEIMNAMQRRNSVYAGTIENDAGAM